MSESVKNQKDILEKLKITELNPMQVAMGKTLEDTSEVILLSPTGSGKTLAFLLPIIKSIDLQLAAVQILILVPSRELAIQIEQVIRSMGAGFKVNAVYGGQGMTKDRLNLKQPPAILVGTPGRVADHFRRETVPTDNIHTLVLDEFDKSLEIGFEEDMREIMSYLRLLKTKILTSATQEVEIPRFAQIDDVTTLNFLETKESQLEIKKIISEDKDKIDALVNSLKHLGNEAGIVFCNFRESIDRVSDALKKRGISHACFHGGMEQKDRERSLIKFRNGSHQLLIATDLAARGIDIPEIRFIIHYHLPNSAAEFTHRNGRTARMKRDGQAFVLQWAKEEDPEYMPKMEHLKLEEGALPTASIWTTVFISGGRKDKISKGDVAGLFLKQGNLKGDEIGLIEIKQDCVFVAVQKSKVVSLIEKVDNSRLKKKKVRVYSL